MITRPTAHVESLTFSGGDEFKFRENDKVILVGPNNSGKSQALREIKDIIADKPNLSPMVLSALQLEKCGTVADLKTFFTSKGELVDRYYRYNDWSVFELHLGSWEQENLSADLWRGFVKLIDANGRLNICAQQKSISPSEQRTLPQHVLFEDGALMDRISNLFKAAFGLDLMFDFRGGSLLPIHTGEIPSSDISVDRVSDAYVKAVRENPLLDEQGDGMKSFAGILFEAVVGNLDITLIDEPEAFLHPPQMVRLGKTLSSECAGQLYVSTHSSDILRGFLEGTEGNIRILRIQRDGDKNIVYESQPEVIKELWMKPELRYSNALEGLFHEQTIICEHDSDCRLFNSAADFISSSRNELWKDTVYVPTGGKHAIPKIASLLREIGVPVKGVFDIDFLSERSLVEKTVKAFGGDWEEFRALWERVDASVRGGVRALSNSEIRAEILELVSNSSSEDLPRSQIIETMKQNKSWNLVKKVGAVGIPNGQAQTDFASLNDKLESVGIYVVTVGEIENFCPDVGSHGPKFVTKLLSTVALSDPKLELLRGFVEKIHKGAAAIN